MTEAATTLTRAALCAALAAAASGASCSTLCIDQSGNLSPSFCTGITTWPPALA